MRIFTFWNLDLGLSLLRIDKQRILDCGEQEGFIAPQRRKGCKEKLMKVH
jgi:hypothetical protein